MCINMPPGSAAATQLAAEVEMNYFKHINNSLYYKE